MARHLYHLEDISAEDAAQVVRQELMSFRRTLRSIEWLLPFIVMLYFLATGIIMAEQPTLQLAIGAYVIFLGCMQLVRWSDKYIWAIISAQIWGMILFITLILWQTGGIWSPLLCLYLFPDHHVGGCPSREQHAKISGCYGFLFFTCASR